jgi:hypothetical protein
MAAMAIALLAGCASGAASLPPDTTSIHRERSVNIEEFAAEDQKKGCDEITTEVVGIRDARLAANRAIEANRGRNQGWAYAGAFFLPAYLGTEGNDAEKKLIRDQQARFDTLVKLAAVKSCSLPHS